MNKSSKELRQLYLDFFKKYDHTVMSSASLVPENDPTVIFTTAGMHPLVPYLLGESHPLGKRLTNAQKCIRTDDIDEVGDKIHHTFFEMLGNWSLGDYFKKEAIQWSFEFVTGKDYLNIPLENFAVSVFAGDKDAPFDQESYDIWLSLGIKPERIAKLPKKNNWWGPAGETGPCGPDTEMFVWTGLEKAPDGFQETESDPNWVEIWNDVFMQYEKLKGEDGFRFAKLKQHNVDTGMGMERALAVLNDTDDNYRTDLFWPIILEIEKLSGYKYGDKTDEHHVGIGEQCWVDVRKSFRIIADHIKAATFAINDGALPSNKFRGYIVRRLIRRAIVKANQINIDVDFTAQIAKKVFEIYKGVYDMDEELVLAELEKEENKFRRTLATGLKQFEKIAGIRSVDAKNLFDLYQSFGFPLELSLELAKEKNIPISTETIEQYNNLVHQHQELSRTASAGMFKGGLADAGEITTKYHTSTHLLLAALRQVLGDQVLQRGSNITAERLRFDFSYPDKMTTEQITEVENIINEKIKEKLPVDLREMSLEDAKNCGAMGVFESKYGEKVKVYTIGRSVDDYFSREICGGPHVENTGLLGEFKIEKEESSGSGIRRIKAVLK